MNKKLSKFARDSLKENIKKLPEDWEFTFKRMYSHNNLELDIETVIDNMPDEKLDWAMQQVENSIKKFKEDNNELHTRKSIIRTIYNKIIRRN